MMLPAGSLVLVSAALYVPILLLLWKQRRRVGFKPLSLSFAGCCLFLLGRFYWNADFAAMCGGVLMTTGIAWNVWTMSRMRDPSRT